MFIFGWKCHLINIKLPDKAQPFIYSSAYSWDQFVPNLRGVMTLPFNSKLLLFVWNWIVALEQRISHFWNLCEEGDFSSDYEGT